MIDHSRRKFLKAASASAAAIAVTRKAPAWASASDKVNVWGTFRDRRHAALDPLEWKPAKGIAANAIQLDMSAT
jgi:hypothetical protein